MWINHFNGFFIYNVYELYIDSQQTDYIRNILGFRLLAIVKIFKSNILFQIWVPSLRHYVIWMRQLNFPVWRIATTHPLFVLKRCEEKINVKVFETCKMPYKWETLWLLKVLYRLSLRNVSECLNAWICEWNKFSQMHM